MIDILFCKYHVYTMIVFVTSIPFCKICTHYFMQFLERWKFFLNFLIDFNCFVHRCIIIFYKTLTFWLPNNLRGEYLQSLQNKLGLVQEKLELVLFFFFYQTDCLEMAVIWLKYVWGLPQHFWKNSWSLSIRRPTLLFTPSKSNFKWLR